MKNSEIYILLKELENLEIGGYISSNSDVNKKYFVFLKDNKWNCDCMAGMMKKECSHIAKMKEKIKIAINAQI